MDPNVTRCPCGNEIAQSPTGRQRLYCSEACKQRAKRLRSQGRTASSSPLEISVSETAEIDAFLVGQSAPVDDQVVAAVHEALLLTVTFRRLGIESRRTFAWRCASMADALSESLHNFFGMDT